VGNAELAQEQGTPEAMKNALDVILKASDTAANILKRFRTLHGSAEKPNMPAVMDVWQVLDEALELMEFQFRKRYILVKKSKHEFMPLVGNRHGLVQVFVNVFMNAMYAMPKGGEIQLKVKVDKQWMEISIHDSGTGIPEDVLPRVTEALFTTKGADGSGLGLSICKEIVEIEHEGQLIIQNHSKGGAEVLIRLPVKPKA